MNIGQHIRRIALLWAFVLAYSVPAHSQFLSTTVSQHEWGITDPSRIQIAQVSVMHRESGDSLLIYTLRDTIPPSLRQQIRGRAPSGSGDYFVISDFAYSQVNALGGVFDTYLREPSASKAGLGDTKDGDRALRFSFDRRKEGYCGLWIQLFNSFATPDNRIYLNIKPFSILSFWIRGLRGGEHLTLRMADARWVEREDAVNIGDVGRFVEGGRIDTAWHLAVIPLDTIPASLNAAQMGSIVIAADSIEKGEVEIKTLALSRDRIHIPTFQKSIRPLALDGSRRAVWTWETDTVCRSQAAIRQFVDFLVQHSFTEVFLAIPYERGNARRTESLRVLHGALNSAIGALHAKRIRVHALIGDKNFVLPEWHNYVMTTVKNIERFNSESAASERFDGIHLDVEPYLLPGFNGPRHQELLADYFELLGNICKEAHGSGLTVGADIPFWYSEPDEFTRSVSTLEYRGISKPVYQHIIDLVDDATVMCYRTASSGMDGIIAHSLDELTYAQEIGKSVFIGLETGPLADERIVTFRGVPIDGNSGSWAGEQLYLITSADTLAFYLIGEDRSRDFATFLRKIADGHYSIFHWSPGRSTLVPGTRLSFATLGMQEFRQTMSRTLPELQQYKSFRGFAVHHYSSYERLSEASALK